MAFLRSALAACALPFFAMAGFAQEQPATILVLDASGSMWGQIDGVNKITIARNVVRDILVDFPEDQNLGLVTYGHRERGACSDIETVIAPAPGTAPKIIGIVDQLNPRGMTPMTDAVIAAAEALRHTEQAARVILVSDGIETCNPDPCAAARALAETGIDFTTHVIGFDVSDQAAALMQMQCIAKETGGLFLTADNAGELSAALRQVVAAPAVGNFSFSAHISPESGAAPVWDWQDTAKSLALLPGDVDWQILSPEEQPIAEGRGNPWATELPFGEYIVRARPGPHGPVAEVQNMFGPDSQRETFVIFAPPPAEVTMVAVLDSPDGAELTPPVTWIFERDIADQDPATAGEKLEYEGNPVTIELPPGQWRATGYHTVEEQEQSTTLTFAPGESARHVMVFPSRVPDLAPARLTAPDQVVIGAVFTVGWQAETLDALDYITIVAPDAAPGSYGAYHRVGTQTEGPLQAPGEPGLYEVRLQTADGSRILGVTSIEVVETAVTLDAPDQVVIGAAFRVGWVAAGLNPRDYVTIVALGAEPGSYTDYHRIAESNKGELRAPAAPGLYEVRLQLADGSRVLASRPIEVVDSTASLEAPDRVVVGSAFRVGWVAAGLNPRDYVTIVAQGAEPGSYTDYHRIADGKEGTLRAPVEPGLYELRLQLADGSHIHARIGIEVIEGEVTISGPARVRAGSDMQIRWTGAIYPRDYVTIVPAATRDGEYGAYSRVGNASETVISAPDDPGLYEIRYHLERENHVMARQVVEVLPADAALDDGAGLNAPARGKAGAVIRVSWDLRRDDADLRLALARIDQADFSWISAETASDRTELDLTLPAEPGTYELRFLDLTDQKVLGRTIIEVQP